MHGTVHKPNATFLSSLYPGPRKEFLRAFAMARHDPLVVPVTRYADYTMPKTRAYRPRYHRHEQQEQQQQQQQQHALPSCGGVSAIAELDAPLFIASERARMLAVEKAPYGMLMGGKSKAEMIAKIRQYKRNASLPLSCRYASCAVVGSSGILRGGRLGAVIDAHDAVIRINAAPTHRHEEAVGRRTTWRIHNSEKPYMMAVSDLPELQVAICHMAWIGSCQHQAFSGAYDETLAYINPRFYSQVYSLLGRPRDLYRHVNPQDAGFTWDGTVGTMTRPSDDDRKRIDYAFAFDWVPQPKKESEPSRLLPLHCSDAHVAPFFVDGRHLSDHFGVSVRVAP